MMAAAATASGSRRSSALLGWALVALSLAYAGLIYHGVGAPGNFPIARWWQPRGLFFTWEAFDSLLAEPSLATLVFAVPAFALVLAVLATTRSAVATTVSLAAALLVLLCCFYGLGGGRRAVWSFFGWRGSGVMALFSLAMAAAILAPFLARRWLELRWPARLSLYVPIVVLVMLAIRDITGTDPGLPFSISPWPVVSMFGIEIGDAGVAALLGMVGLDLAATDLLRQRRYARGIVCALLSLVIPIWIFGLGLGLDTGLLALVVAAAAAQLWLARDADAAAGGLATLMPAARSVTLGAALVALPILGGQLLVARDYDVTRNTQAKRILDALDAYYARQSLYPDALADLVASKDLEAIPEPQIGFGLFEEPRFTYQSFGTTYMLEFSAPRWVQCAYNPPYLDEGGEEGGEAAEEDGAAGSWSCPQKPPELW